MYKIDKKVALPKKREKYPFKGMAVGDSFLISTENDYKVRNSVASGATYFARKCNWKFSVRFVNGELRCWRTA